MGDESSLDFAAADPRLCEQCHQLDLSMAGRDLSGERQALAERAGSSGRYTPMTDIGVRVACIGKWYGIKGKTDCPLCHILIRDREHDAFSDLDNYLQNGHDLFFYAFSGQYCFQESGMDLKHNFLVVGPDLDSDPEYGMDPVLVNDRQIHGMNHKLHPDFARRNNRYIVCQATSKPSRSYGLQPRPIPGMLDISRLKGWLEVCQTSHGPCQTGSEVEEFPPDMRLVDCQRRVVIDAGSINTGDSPSYVALSYVWGGTFHPPMQPDGRLPADIPQVIEDAMYVTMATGHRHLWVDQYCIDQHDTPHKLQQIKIMDRIYSSAAWTIVDGAGENADHGLAGISRPRLEDLAAVRMTGGVEVFYWPSYSAQMMDESKWATRAWTYQEAFFSRRIVIFTTKGLYFECQTTFENEGLVRHGDTFLPDEHSTAAAVEVQTSADSLFPRYRYGPLTRSSEPWATRDVGDVADRQDALQNFWQRVQEYSCRQMTFPEDSLAAFRGILQFYVRQLPVHHGVVALANVCGIPFTVRSPPVELATSHELSFGLCWSHPHGRTSCRRPSFPSWSWAGWMGQVHGGSDEHVESLLCGISFETINSDGSHVCRPWYEMEGQDPEVLVLEGNVLPYDALSKTETDHWDAFRLGPHARFDLDENLQHEVILQGLRGRTYVIVPVALLSSHQSQSGPYYSARMLLLRKNRDVFERVGLFILGGSLISFKLTNLINEGKTLWDTATLRII